MSKKSDAALEPQQERFCLEFIKDLHGTKAAERAGYSAKTAAQQASRLLRNVKVWSRVQELKETQFKRLEVSSDKILRELIRLGYSDISELIDGDTGCVKDPSQWPKSLARAVRSFEVLEEYEYHQSGFHCEECGRKAKKELVGRVKKISFWDKPKALELLGKHRKLFTDKVEHSGKLTLEELVAGSRDDDEGEK